MLFHYSVEKKNVKLSPCQGPLLRVYKLLPSLFLHSPHFPLKFPLLKYVYFRVIGVSDCSTLRVSMCVSVIKYLSVPCVGRMSCLGFG